MQVNGYDVIVGDKWQCKDGSKIVIKEIIPDIRWCIKADWGRSFNKNGYYDSTEKPGPCDLDYPTKIAVCDEEYAFEPVCDEEYAFEPVCDEDYAFEPVCDEDYAFEPVCDEIIEDTQPIVSEDINPIYIEPSEDKIGVAKFIKYDNNKPRFDLVDPFFEEDIAKVLSMGAAKYEANNWQLNEDINRYIGALQRHLNDIKKGIYKDKESKLQHTAHIACNAMFIHWMIKNGKVSK